MNNRELRRRLGTRSVRRQGTKHNGRKPLNMRARTRLALLKEQMKKETAK